MFKRSSQGEISTLLVLGAFLMVGVATFLSSTLTQNRNTTITQASGNVCDKPEGCGGRCDLGINLGCGYGGCRWWERCQNGSCLDTTAGGIDQAAPDACHNRSTAGNQPQPTSTPRPTSGSGTNPTQPPIGPCNKMEGCGGQCNKSVSNGCGYGGCRSWEACGSNNSCLWDKTDTNNNELADAGLTACGSQPAPTATSAPVATATPTPTFGAVIPRETSTPTPGSSSCDELGESCCNTAKGGGGPLCYNGLACGGGKCVTNLSPTNGPKPTSTSAPTPTGSCGRAEGARCCGIICDPNRGITCNNSTNICEKKQSPTPTNGAKPTSTPMPTNSPKPPPLPSGAYIVSTTKSRTTETIMGRECPDDLSTLPPDEVSCIRRP